MKRFLVLMMMGSMVCVAEPHWGAGGGHGHGFHGKKQIGFAISQVAQDAVRLEKRAHMMFKSTQPVFGGMGHLVHKQREVLRALATLRNVTARLDQVARLAPSPQKRLMLRQIFYRVEHALGDAKNDVNRLPGAVVTFTPAGQILSELERMDRQVERIGRRIF